MRISNPPPPSGLICATPKGPRIALPSSGSTTRLYAIGDRCSHADVSLAEGTVYDDECQLECIKHGSLFSLINGEALTFPATRPVPVYEIRQDGERILVRVPGEIHAGKPHDPSTNAWSSASSETAAQAKQGPAA